MMSEGNTKRPDTRWLRTALLSVAGGALVIGSVAAYLRRPHAIQYSADVGDCDGTATFALSDEETQRVTFHGHWESAEMTVLHGDTALVSVASEGRCQGPIRCSLREDGVLVAEGTGDVGAVCSAFTAR